MVWVDLIYNLALLVALSVVSGFVDTRWKRNTRLGTLLQGVVFGGAAVIGMLRPFVFAPGLIFDGRSVMISLGALFFGPWTAAVACLMTIPLRVLQGGPGAVMGVSVILASAAIGVGFHLRRPPTSREVSVKTLVVFGIVVHLAMLALTVALPREMILPVLKRIGWPVILIYPLATVLIGKILSDQAARAGFLESLQESERRFRAIFNSTYQFTGLLTLDGTLTEVNQSALEFAGIKGEEVVGRPFWETHWWRGNEARVRQLQQAITRAAGGEFVRYEVELQGAGTTTAIVDFSLTPVFDPAGRVTLLIPEGRNITERKRIEEALRAGEERLTRILETMPDGITIVNREGQITYANPGAERMLGLTRSGITGRAYNDPAWKCMTVEGQPFPDDQQPFTRVMHSGHAVYGIEQVIEHSDGRRVILSINAAPLRDASSTLTGMVAALSDVTERRGTEQALRTGEERLRLAQAVAGIGIWDIDLIRDYASWSEQEEAIFGFAPGTYDHTSDTFWKLLHPEDRERVRAATEDAIRNQGEFDAEYRIFRHGDNALRWVAVRGRALHNAAGHAVRMLGVTIDITEHKQIEAELERNQERYRRAIAAANAIPYQKAYAADQYTFMGEGIKDLTGYTPTELRSAVWRQMILETVFLGEAAGLDRAEASRRAIAGEITHWRVDHRIRTRTGEIRWISDSSIPLFDDNGKYSGSMGIIQDITERKQAEEAIRRSEASLALAQRVAHLGSWEIDLALDALTWSDETYRIFGLSPEAFTPTREAFRATVHPEDQLRVQAAVRESIRSRQPYVLDHRILRPDGSERIVTERADVLIDAAGQPIRLVGTVQDVTELKRAEQALQRSEKHFRSIIDTVQDLVSIVDVNGVLRFISPSSERALGYAPEQLLDRDIFDFIPPDEHALVRAALVRALGESRQPVAVQHHFRHADGSWRLLESIGNVLGGETSQAVVVNSRDITDRRRLEDQLRQSQKMEAIGQLAAGVAHDFNNLLTIIQGNASLLLTAPGLSEEDSGSTSQIIQASERAAGLTRQLLMFSRKQVMRLAHLDLNEVVGNMTKMLQRILGEDVTLRSEYAPNLPLIHADAGMLEQVLLNLAVNARDAMPDGGQLRIETSALTLVPHDLGQHPEAAAGPHVCLRVSDTGCGIAPENLPRIFDPFFTTKEVGKGTGLGLATVYGIVKQHRGWIEASSELSQGTTFQIYLPAAEGSAAAQRAGAAAQELPRGREVILVVEDEPAVRLLVNNLLQRCGYTVLMAESGVAALEVWKEHQDRIELLLTDMVMPDGMSGRELARTLKQDNPDLKVIYTSGYSAATTGEVPPLTEGVNFLQKPYPPYHLAKTVRACLDRA